MINYYGTKKLYLDNQDSERKYNYEYNIIKEMVDVNSDCS
jgi:hypothetical protein